MKKYFLIIILLLTGISYSLADNEPQRYVISNKAGKARFVPVEREGENWKYIKSEPHIYLENGIEVGGFEIKPDKSLNYSGTPYISQESFIIEHEGKFYVDPFPKKDLKPVNENGELTSGLGIRNYLSNTKLGDFYRTPLPGLLALLCVFISGTILISLGVFPNVTFLMKWVFVLPLCVISVLEIGAAISVGTDAVWWVNPDDVGYWIATPLLVPYSLGAALMIFSYKLYGFVGRVDGTANTIITVLLIIGTVLTVISAIFVVINFLFSICLMIGAAYLFRGMDIKNADGSVTNIGPLGTYRTDRNGKTTHIR